MISNCAYIAHYIIGDHCILIDNAEIHVSNHSKFGSGNIVEGEGEEVRITIDVMNEAGGRAIYPFEGMTCAGRLSLGALPRQGGSDARVPEG